jgi:adenylosuccinate lyase
MKQVRMIKSRFRFFRIQEFQMSHGLGALTALSPLDGRYAAKVDLLRPHFSEFGLIHARLRVEIEWLKALAADPHFTEIPAFSAATIAELDGLVNNFTASDAAEVKGIEATTNHDVKALEYWIKDKTKANAEVTKVSEFIHFACTS